MGIPGSGRLRMKGDLVSEVRKYAGETNSNLSLREISEEAGFTAPHAFSELYGYTAAVAPSVSTSSPSSVGVSSMRLNGNITNDGGGTISERGFYIGTNSSSPTNNTKVTAGSGAGSYNITRSGLSSNTTYYVWAFATNEAGTSYGSRVTQATPFNYTFADGRFYGSMNTNNHNVKTYYSNVDGGYTQKASWTPETNVCGTYSNIYCTNRNNKLTVFWGSNTSGTSQYHVMGVGSRIPTFISSSGITYGWATQPNNDPSFWGCSGAHQPDRISDLGGGGSGDFSVYTDGVTSLIFSYS